jgi:type I restriction enzyme S subunit
LGYALQGTGFIDAVVANSTGVSYPAINPTTLVCLPFGYPKDKKEQQQIAAFLDWKTGQIDGLIGKKKELLEKLKEKRLAVITQAVTRGLNPAAPLKVSGTPWLGKVPEHWHVMRLKDYGRLVGGAGFPIDEQGLTDEELPFYKVGDLKEAADGRNMSGAPNSISRETAERLSAKIIPAGAVVYAKIGAALLLNRRRVTSVPCCIDNNMTAYVPDPAHLEIRWVHYWLSILDFGEFVNPGAVPSLSEGYQSVVPILVPELKEQKIISDYLDAALPKIEQLIDATERTIARLTEYRTALITAATTGKIDVRNVKIPAFV